MKYKILIAIVSLILGGAAGYYLTPTKTEIKVKEVKVTEVQERVRVVTKIQERPDGTKETVITEESITDTSSTTNKQASQITERALPQWRVGASYNFIDTYTARLERRLLGPVWGGVYGRTDGEFGVSLSLEF